ncbi:MAG: penicillin-binding protein [Clostridia bacterium]|nr:penicillin-binding protein [Clostridia bacterium]
MKKEKNKSNNSEKAINENVEIENKDKKFHKLKPKINLEKIKKIFAITFIIIIMLAFYTGLYISNWQNLARNMIYNSPSSIFDTNGNLIAEIGNSKKTKNIPLSEMPENLKNAYISIEDQRFYKHSGVDFPRTTAAIFSYIKNLGSSSFGGSSITQQLVKNLTGDNSSSVLRKVKEWIRAIALESILEKNEILQAYLNIIYVGPNIYGVSLGANYYFDKDVNELNLEECAFLAGINNSPNSYNPFGEKDNSEKIKNRTKTVLSKMFELDYINENDYKLAIENVEKGLNFKQRKIENTSKNNIYSYHTDSLLNEIITDISEKKHISIEFATNYIEMAGLKIYSTQNSSIQKAIENELSNPKYIIKSQENPSVIAQAAMVVIDHTNGQVLGCVGGIGKKEISRGLNRATQSTRQTGSAGKPIAVLVPAIDKKIITASSIYNDAPTKFDDGTEEGYSPTDYNNYQGNITVRKAVESSQNIPFVKIMEQLTPQVSINYMINMGITSLTDIDNNLNLALGGLDKGISPLEMAVSYSTIANDGVYIEPTFYTRIENANGKIIQKTKQTRKKVFSKEVAFIVKSLLKEPVDGTHGTAKYCKINNIDVAAKTGTTNADYDRWLCGFTPYYTATTWFGFDYNETINFNNKNPAGQVWSSVMKTIHSEHPGKQFAVPAKIETADVCPLTDLIATDICKDAYMEYYLEGTVSTELCLDHSNVKENIVNEPEAIMNSNSLNTNIDNAFEQ